MKVFTRWMGGATVCCYLSLAVAVRPPTVEADPVVTLPPMTSTGSGPLVSSKDAVAPQQVSQQLVSFSDPNIQEVDGSDAAQFIMAAAAVPDRDLADVFLPVGRVMGCQENKAGFAARAYRRTDGRWGGAMLAIAKSAVSDIDAFKGCVKSGWRKPVAGGPTSMCDSGWAYPRYADSRHREGYFVLLAGTASDFCSKPNSNYRGTASAWP